MAKIPNKVRIAGLDYKIDCTKTIEQLTKMVCTESENISVMGCNKQSSQLIFTAKDIPNGQQQLTLIHEIMHGIFNHYMPGLPEDVCEDYVNLVSNGLFQVLADNPKVAQDIFAGGAWITKPTGIKYKNNEGSEVIGPTVE